MPGAERWIDLVDPDPAALAAALPTHLHATDARRLRSPVRHDDEPRPRIEAHGDDVCGVLVLAAIDSSGEVTRPEINDGLDLARDLLAGVRDFHQAQVANDQNEAMKRLTVVASVLLLPTFIVGLYRQNLRGPEFHWSHGHLLSWALIIATTVGQLRYYRRKRWI